MIVHLPHALSSESLDDLADLAATLFSPIPNRGCEPLPMINDHPFGPEEKGVHFTNDLDIYTIQPTYTSPLDSRLSTNNHGFPCSGNIIPIGIPSSPLEI